MKPKTKKILGIVGITFCLLLGTLIYGLSGFAFSFAVTLKGYLGYCASAPLPYTFHVIMAQVVLGTLLTCGLILIRIWFKSEKFDLAYKLTSLFNLGFISYLVIEFPILVYKSSTWGSRITDSSFHTHPLFYFSLFQLILILASYFTTQKRKKRDNLILGLSTLLILIQAVRILTTSTESCFG